MTNQQCLSAQGVFANPYNCRRMLDSRGFPCKRLQRDLQAREYDVDSRSQEQLKIAFGTSFCTFRTFSYRSDAENFAKKNNMDPGKSCSCK